MIDALGDDLSIRSTRPRDCFQQDDEGVVPYRARINESIAKAIDTCDIALIFLSRENCNSDYSLKEARKLGKIGKRCIPIEIDREREDDPGDGILREVFDQSDINCFRSFEKDDQPLGYPTQKLFKNEVSLARFQRLESKLPKEINKNSKGEHKENENGNLRIKVCVIITMFVEPRHPATRNDM